MRQTVEYMKTKNTAKTTDKMWKTFETLVIIAKLILSDEVKGDPKALLLNGGINLKNLEEAREFLLSTDWEVPTLE